MQKEELKKDILERINQIDDSNKLSIIQTLLNTLENEELSVDMVHNALETEDFSGYIKEWLKDM
jgi:meiotically up-regulated gene 157 (Mug157) protein